MFYLLLGRRQRCIDAGTVLTPVEIADVRSCGRVDELLDPPNTAETHAGLPTGNPESLSDLWHSLSFATPVLMNP